ncbi:phasin family protein [Azospirillum sp. B506]|uniref:phasin family protein n=1 Tax=Azospirillum sp. B506 TaxID=137721 RepID=UPI0005B28BFC|nr:phasin family protein [Azospirillum sp. B506]
MVMDKDTTTGVRETADRAKATVEEITRAGEAATRRAADAARSIGGTAAEAGAQAADSGLDAGRKALDAGAGLTRDGSEAAGSVMGSATEATARTTEQMQRLLGLSKEAQGQVASQTRETMDVMVQCGSVLADGMKTAWREWIGLAQDMASRNAEGVNALMRSRSVPDFYAAQSRMLKENMQLVLSRSVKISELSSSTANTAIGKLNARLEGTAQQTERRF